MGAVDLAVNVAGVDEKDLVLALTAALAAVEEPERDREGHRVEEIRPDRDDHVDTAVLDELGGGSPSPSLVRRSRVGNDEARSTVFVERRVESLDPEVVDVVRLGMPNTIR